MSILYDTRLTKIEFQKEKIYFDKDGYWDQSITGIIWEGDMLEKRVGTCFHIPTKWRNKNH